MNSRGLLVTLGGAPARLALLKERRLGGPALGSSAGLSAASSAQAVPGTRASLRRVRWALPLTGAVVVGLLLTGSCDDLGEEDLVEDPGGN